MTDDVASSNVPAAPAPAAGAPPSSLEGAAAASKAQIESWMGDAQSPYWRGNDERSAAWIQSHYRDLLRAEEHGESRAIGPTHDADGDLPVSIDQYNIAGANGARSMTAEDRDVVDGFLPVAMAGGLGQRKVLSAIGWALTIPGLTVDQFRDLAIAADWSDRAIDTCLGWWRSETARRGRSG